MDKKRIPIKVRLAEWLYATIADDWGGSPSPPGSNQRLEFGEMDDGEYPYLATTYNNDGFELWLHWGGGWAAFYKAKEARRLAWFILWTWWAKSTWFGLKRRLWYWGLHEHLEYWRPIWKEIAREHREQLRND